ncbi:MAG: glycoside hydrolase family 43 protein [Candidatus Hinthialibacter antarcticus]|nr:glycoside hydrolase family 43 protein [Candidatus Hinthialibacter antarcticus]
MPDTAKDQEFKKKRQKNAIQFVIKHPNTGRTTFIVQICVLVFACCLFLQAETTHSQTEPTFTNPIAESGADPWVTQRDGSYFYCYSRRNRIWVSRAQHLEDIGNATPAAVWTPPENTAHSKELWAPELHYLRGKWYIYVAADDGDNFNHRMYVLEGATQNPLDPFVFKGKVTDATDRWAIDATVLQMPGDQLYFIWSGWEGEVNVQQNLYIAPMSDPLTISGARVCISKPQLDWELHGKPLINEGPQILKNGDKVFIIYSASGSWTDDYCLGQLALVGDDPLDPQSWKKKPQPVFSRTEDVFGPGHASFVKSPNGNEDWIVYHSAKHSGAGWNRKVNIQPFTWNPDGSPNFGRPIAPGVSLPAPQRD